MGAFMNTKGPVWVIEIDRPSRRNAVDSTTAKNLSFMLEEANANPHCHCVIFRGSGGWFSAGSDLKELAGCTPTDMAAIESSKAELARTIGEVNIPVIAAVAGFALGGGLALAAACDYVIADANSKWQMPEVANGWLPPWGIEPVIKRCGEFAARHIFWGAEPLDAHEAHRLGLVDIVTGPDGAQERAEKLADRIAQLPSTAVRSVKAYQRSADRKSAVEADQLASQEFQLHCATTQAQLTLNKFVSKK
jgi:enoyl-CoA hydratase/carnithine racemase